MSSYSYSPLPANGENIRLLRLLPSDDEAAPLHCELRDYPLRRSTPRTHLYEALSYVWGDPHNTLPIYVDKKQFQVTVNLHAALLSLRDHSFERILWIDAICIDQNNIEERNQQVQLMAKIYSRAYRVVVWLGEETVETRGALEVMQLFANEEVIKHSKEEIKRQYVLNLLRNPWFQRIWVLQEVAAARNVVIMCGSTIIDGSIFCLGVQSLNLSYSDSPELQTIPSVIYLIERAGFRPKLTEDLSERFSLNIRSLPELIDMFHTRQATDSRDKVFALLGMSSDDHEKAGLQLNYETSWEVIFQQLVRLVLGTDIFVETSSQRAVIKCKGIIIGLISSVKREYRQYVNITSRIEARDLRSTMEWTLQASAKPIQEHDIICLLYGASKPTIIRLCKDHFAVVVIAATPLNVPTCYEWPQLSQSKTQFLRDLVLVWDWESSCKKLQDHGEYEALKKTFSQALVFSKMDSERHLNEAIRLWNDVAILDDLAEYEEADKRLLEAVNGYTAAFGKGSLLGQISQHGRTLLSFTAGEGHEDIVKLLLKTINPDIIDRETARTPLSFAAENGHEAVVKLLLATHQIDPDSKGKLDRTPLSFAAENRHEAVVKLLLTTGQVEADSKDEYDMTPLLWAARNGHDAVVKLLLTISQVKADSKDKYDMTPLSWAARNGHDAVVKLLLATSQVKADSKDKYDMTPLSWASITKHETVVKLLLAAHQVEADLKDKYDDWRPVSWATKPRRKAAVRLRNPI